MTPEHGKPVNFAISMGAMAQDLETQVRAQGLDIGPGIGSRKTRQTEFELLDRMRQSMNLLRIQGIVTPGESKKGEQRLFNRIKKHLVVRPIYEVYELDPKAEPHHDENDLIEALMLLSAVVVSNSLLQGCPDPEQPHRCQHWKPDRLEALSDGSVNLTFEVGDNDILLNTRNAWASCRDYHVLLNPEACQKIEAAWLQVLAEPE